ncbi:MAG: hypothetical protein LBJ46_11105 [Planctomycetota bacterium]|jgi:hypothetical protein|nr:hypothetical protein [Planctomycetota bacterium]
MKKFFFKLALFVVLLATIAGAAVLLTLFVAPNYSENDYMASFLRKYGRLKNTEPPRIILIGGSATAFGLDQYLLEEMTGYPVVNMAVHAGLGPELFFAPLRDEIGPGDIVVICFEFVEEWGNDYSLLLDLNDYTFLHFVPSSDYPLLARLIPAFMVKKWYYYIKYGVLGRKLKTTEESPYRLAAFDGDGQMIYPRPKSLLDDALFAEMTQSPLNTLFHDSNIEILDGIYREASESGSVVLLSFPPVLKEAVDLDAAGIDKEQTAFETKLAVPIISKISDYLFDRELMYDTTYHCNTAGEKRRTELLGRDINAYLAAARLKEEYATAERDNLFPRAATAVLERLKMTRATRWRFSQTP